MSEALLAASLGWALLALALALVARTRSTLRSARPQAALGPTGGVHLLRPIAGLEPRLEENLSSLGDGWERLGLRVTFVAGAPDDPALGPAERAAGLLKARGLDVAVLVAPPAGPNRKAAQLAYGDRVRSDDAALLWCCDSDVDLSGREVTRLFTPLAAPRVAAAWAQPVERGEGTSAGDPASRALLGGSWHSFPLLAGIDPAGLVGKCWVARRAALTQLGGIGALDGVLGEDHELAARLTRAGLRVVPAALVVPSTAAGRTQEEAVARFGRWLQVVRFQRPWLLPSYPLIFLHAAPGAALSLLAAGLGPSWWVEALGIAGVHALVRSFVVAAAGALSGDALARRGAGEVALDLLRADGLLWRALWRCCTTDEIRWRGRRYGLSRGGLLRERPGHVPAGEGGEQLLGERRERRTAAPQERDGAGGRDATAELFVEGVEPFGDGALLRGGERLHIATGGERLAEAHVQGGPLRRAELVPDGDGQRRDAGGAGDRGGAPGEAERAHGHGALAALGIDPDEAAGAIEQLCGVTQRAGAIGGGLQVDAEPAELREERQALEVARVHERVAVRAKLAGEQERDERVPPAGVVPDDDRGDGGEQRAGGRQALHAHLGEALLHPGPDVPAEPGLERGALVRGDHGALRRTS